MIKCDNCGFGHKTTKEFDACNTPQAQAETKHTPRLCCWIDRVEAWINAAPGRELIIWRPDDGSACIRNKSEEPPSWSSKARMAALIYAATNPAADCFYHFGSTVVRVQGEA